MELNDYFHQHKKAALAFSGGVDSAYLLWAARAAGCDLHAYFVKSPFQPQFELEDAKRLAAELSVPFTVEEFDVLCDPLVAENGPLRCYYCKRALFSRLGALSAADGYPLLMDGTNASDEWDDRPGMRALAELGVVSPLRECGLTKARIRALSKEAGLFTHDKPAYACLATRIPTGTAITPELLALVERGEDALFRLGFTDLRVRCFHGAARVQVTSGQMPRAAQSWAAIDRALRDAGFSDVLLDLKPR